LSAVSRHWPTAPGAARELDCLVRCEEENLERLAAAMRELGARLRVEGLSDEEAKALPLPPDGRWLRDRELSTWRTDAGDFDVLTNLPGRDGRRLSYEELAGRAVAVEATGVIITVAGLDDVIASKEWANRPKDHDALSAMPARSGQPYPLGRSSGALAPPRTPACVARPVIRPNRNGAADRPIPSTAVGSSPPAAGISLNHVAFGRGWRSKPTGPTRPGRGRRDRRAS